MTDNKAISNKDITPALSKDVAFGEKLQAVDDALKSRGSANAQIKLKWAEVVKVLVKYDHQDIPARRQDAQSAAYLVNEVKIYPTPDPRLENRKLMELVTNDSFSYLRHVSRSRKMMEYLESKAKGFTKAIDELAELDELRGQSVSYDRKATKEARKEVQKVVDEYVAALEAYEDTVQRVSDVKEYVAVVKDVAEIAAISQGQLSPNRGN